MHHKKAELDDIQTTILNQVGKLAGELDISIPKSSSESMKILIEMMLSLGIRIGITDPSLNPQDGFIQLSQPEVNKDLKIYLKRTDAFYKCNNQENKYKLNMI